MRDNIISLRKDVWGGLQELATAAEGYVTFRLRVDGEWYTYYTATALLSEMEELMTFSGRKIESIAVKPQKFVVVLTRGDGVED